MKKLLPAIFVLLAFFFIFPSSSQAQSCGVAGAVTTPAGEPLPNVFIGVHAPKGTLRGSDWTDSAGYYSIPGLSCDIELIEYVVCGIFVDPGVTFGPIGSGTYTLNRPGIDCMVGPVPPPPPPPPPPPGYTCGPSGEERVSRPDKCKLCNETDLYCASCATSFTVSEEVEWQWKERDLECEGEGRPDWKITPWGGSITINPSDTTIPFVGYKGGEDEIKYLADYFEGTHDYYKTREYPLRVGPLVVAHGVNPIFTTNYQGVLRKLTPYEYQNQLKREMVQRAKTSQPGQEGSIHDYQLNYLGRLCWDVPLILDILTQIIEEIAKRAGGFELDPSRATYYCLFEVVPLDTPLITYVRTQLWGWNNLNPLGRLFPIHYWYEKGVRDNLSNLVGPPEPDEEDYAKKWDEWKFTSPGNFSAAGKLWEVTPMVSREDTKGHIIPYLGSKPNDTFTIENPEALVEKVPHVARLYEATQIVNNILTPYVAEEEEMSQKKTSPIIASAKESTEEKVLGEKTLLAQGPGCVPCGCKYYYGDSYNDCSCMGDIKPDGEPNCRAEPGGGGGCPIKKHWRIYGTICGWSDCKPTERGCSPPGKTCCGGSVNPNPPPDIPTCGLPGPLPVYHCEQPAITDPNDNDDLCCELINITLEAEDMFNDYPYTPCEYGWVCKCPPSWPEDCPPEIEKCTWELLNPECNNWEYRTVSRDIGINLLHPYLTEIWDQTGNVDTSGLFNFFRPDLVPEFEEIDASSEIRYSQTGFDSIEPTVGKFYFNYLGGVQLAKDWLIRALTPWVE